METIILKLGWVDLFCVKFVESNLLQAYRTKYFSACMSEVNKLHSLINVKFTLLQSTLAHLIQRFHLPYEPAYLVQISNGKTGALWSEESHCKKWNVWKKRKFTNRSLAGSSSRWVVVEMFMVLCSFLPIATTCPLSTDRRKEQNGIRSSRVAPHRTPKVHSHHRHSCNFPSRFSMWIKPIHAVSFYCSLNMK